MRKKIIAILAGTVLLAAAFTGLFFYQKQTVDRQKNEAEQPKKKVENSSPSRKEKEDGKQIKEKEKEIGNGEKESRKEEGQEGDILEMVKEETVPDMELSGFPKECCGQAFL